MIVQDSIQTVNKQIQSITNSELIEVYKEIINSQNQTYSTLIFAFIGIIALFAGASWLYNTRIAKEQIKKITKEIYLKEKELILKEIKKDFKKELYSIKGNNARSFAARTMGHNTINGNVNSFTWWLTTIKWYKLSKEDMFVRIGVEKAIYLIGKMLEEEKDSIIFYKENYIKYNEAYLKIIKSIPELLKKEKEELLKLTEEFFSKL